MRQVRPPPQRSSQPKGAEDRQGALALVGTVIMTLRVLLSLWPGLLRIVTWFSCLAAAYLAGVVTERGANAGQILADFFFPHS